jgi:hypothetical protein
LAVRAERSVRSEYEVPNPHTLRYNADTSHIGVVAGSKSLIIRENIGNFRDFGYIGVDLYLKKRLQAHSTVAFDESAVASHPEERCVLLQPSANASRIRQEHAGFRRTQRVSRIAAIPILGGVHHQYVRV